MTHIRAAISRGRPRKHASASERVQEFRRLHNYEKVTIDVPRQYADEFRKVAKLARQHRQMPRDWRIKELRIQFEWRTLESRTKVFQVNKYIRALIIPCEEDRCKWRIERYFRGGESVNMISEGCAVEYSEAEAMIEGVLLGMLRYHFTSIRIDKLDMLK